MLARRLLPEHKHSSLDHRIGHNQDVVKGPRVPSKNYLQRGCMDQGHKEHDKAVLIKAGLPLPPEGELLQVRWRAAQDDWYAETDRGWFWFDARDKAWKPSLYGPL